MTAALFSYASTSTFAKTPMLGQQRPYKKRNAISGAPGDGGLIPNIGPPTS
jgi:hypothetical protein